MDETVRSYFHEIAHKIDILMHIAWVNRYKSEETPLDWLREGAQVERERLLAHSRA